MSLPLLFRVQDKTPWLDPTIQKDQPIPLFKPWTQIISENALSFGLLALFLFSGLLTWIYLRKRSALSVEPVIAPPIDPYQEALDNIGELQSRKPSLRPKPFVFRLSEILRVYVEKLFKVPAMELTSEEFMREIVSHSFFRNRYEDVLREFVNRGDRVKYSKELMDQDQMNQLLNTALHIVKDTHMRLQEEKTEPTPVIATNTK
jgi:hypothetical protein